MGSPEERARIRDTALGKAIGLDDQVAADAAMTLSSGFEQIDLASALGDIGKSRDLDAGMAQIDAIERHLAEGNLSGDARKNAKSMLKEARERLEDADDQLKEMVDNYEKAREEGIDILPEEVAQLRAMTEGTRHAARMNIFDMADALPTETPEAKRAIMANARMSLSSLADVEAVSTYLEEMGKAEEKIDQSIANGTRLDQIVQTNVAIKGDPVISPIADYTDPQSWAARMVEVDAVKERSGPAGVGILTQPERQQFKAFIEQADTNAILATMDSMKGQMAPEQWRAVETAMAESGVSRGMQHAARIARGDAGNLSLAQQVRSILDTPDDQLDIKPEKRKEIKDGLKDVEFPVVEALRSQSALTGNAALLKQANDFEADVHKVAYGMGVLTAESDPVGTAAETMGAGFEVYQDDDAVIVHDGSAGDIEGIARGLNGLRSAIAAQVDPDQFAIPDEAEDFRSVIMDEAIWVNAGDGFGLFDPLSRTFVSDRQGNAIIVTPEEAFEERSPSLARAMRGLR